MTKKEYKNDIVILEGIIKEVSNELYVHQGALELATRDVVEHRKEMIDIRVSYDKEQEYVADLEDENIRLHAMVRGQNESIDTLTVHNESLQVINKDLLSEKRFISVIPGVLPRFVLDRQPMVRVTL